MFFYNLTVYFAEGEGDKFFEVALKGRIRRLDYGENGAVKNLLKDTDEYNKKIAPMIFFVSEINADHFNVGIDGVDLPIITKDIRDFLSAIQVEYRDWKIEEIRICDFEKMINTADRCHFITDDLYSSYKRILQDLGHLYKSENMTEGMFHSTGRTMCALKKACGELLSKSLSEELDRISSVRARKTFVGHPAQYMIETDNHNFEQEALDTLLSALYSKKRIASHRICKINMGTKPQVVDKMIYKCAYLGCLVIKMPEDNTDRLFSPDAIRPVEKLAKLAKEFQNNVLTIFLLPKGCNRMKEVLFRNAQGCTFVEITQDKLDRDKAMAYLSHKAKECHVKANEDLYQKLGVEDQYFDLSELDGIFESWLSGYLKGNVFPAYAQINCPVVEVKKEEPVGDAYRELENMVGLTEVKQVIDEALDYFKAQKLFRDKGLQSNHPVMHMVFTGNPGTAKTTVARLFARIMKDNGILSKGKLYEVSRADLIGKYCGWTAQNVKDLFQESKGSVLFIDEAYSLMDHQEGHFGDEAINTLVDEMENHKEDVIVILAGYPREMERLLDRNTGLRSRIAYHVSFPDYSTVELYEIAEIQAQKNGLRLEPDVEEALIPVLEEARENKNFGNGRFVRNLIEDAEKKQASRLLSMDYDDVTTEMVTTLQASDFEYFVPEKERAKNPIGFRMDPVE